MSSEQGCCQRDAPELLAAGTRATHAFHSAWLGEYVSYSYYLFLLFTFYYLFFIPWLHLACCASVISSVVAYSLTEDALLGVNTHQILREAVLGDALPPTKLQPPLAVCGAASLLQEQMHPILKIHSSLIFLLAFSAPISLFFPIF